MVRGVAQVDLAAEFAELGSDRQLLAIAQLVLTLTSRPGVGQVAFTLDTAPIDVPRADGTITSDPVTRADYASMLAGS